VNVSDALFNLNFSQLDFLLVVEKLLACWASFRFC